MSVAVVAVTDEAEDIEPLEEFRDMTLFELNLWPNQFDLPVRLMELGHVDILVFFGAWLL